MKMKLFMMLAFNLLLSSTVLAAVEAIYWTDWGDDAVYRVNGDGTGKSAIISNITINSLDGIAIDPGQQKLYIGTSYDLLRTNLDGSGMETIISGGNAFDVYGVTLDLDNSKVYWSTWQGSNGIRRSNLDGTGVETVYSGSTTYKVSIDHVNSKLYWGTTSKIIRADLDGSNQETLVNLPYSGNPSGIALDVENGKMYYSCSQLGATELGGIYQANLDGSMQSMIIQDKTMAIDLDLTDDKIYWTSWFNSPGDIRMANLDGTNIDNICSLNASNSLAIQLVPEPATLVLLALGGIMLRKRN